MKHKEVIKMEIPEWALCYLVNGDSTGLSDEDTKMVQDWERDNHVYEVEPLEEEGSFSRYPEFGKACNVVECNVFIYA